MEPKGSLPHLQAPTTCPCPEQQITNTKTKWDGYLWNVKRKHSSISQKSGSRPQQHLQMKYKEQISLSCKALQSY